MGDPMMDSLLNLSELDDGTFQSPSLSPSTSNKVVAFSRPVKTEPTAASLLPAAQPFSGPSHQYDLYKQQTGMVPGALASTIALNQTMPFTGYTDFGTDYLGIGDGDASFDFNTAPSQGSMSTPDMDMDFDSPSADPNFFFESTINPSTLSGQSQSTLSSPMLTTPVSAPPRRVFPGVHTQQAALAKQQQQQQQRHQAQQSRQQRPKSAQPSDPIVEQKISQLLNSMRQKSMSEDSNQDSPQLNLPRMKKDEEDMDEDERLLASEEGKKLSSKERRQLRNKVSARAFRSRRKEYITQLEAEIANKVTENGNLRAENRALADENKRLTDLTRMLLSSPSFSDFLDRLSSNPQAPGPSQPQAQQQQQQQSRQPPKDINPYAAQQQIGLAMIPEQNVDFSMLNLEPIDGFGYQPQVFTVLDTPEPALDAAVLSGKTSDFVSEQLSSPEEEKVEMPIIEHPAVAKKEEPTVTVAPINEEFETNPAFALYHDSPASERTSAPVELDTDGLSNIDIFGGIEPEKVLARFELVDAGEDDASAALAMARVQRISANLESTMARLETLTIGLEL